MSDTQPNARVPRLLVWCAAAVAATLLPTACARGTVQDDPAPDVAEGESAAAVAEQRALVARFVAANCISCHGPQSPAGGLSLADVAAGGSFTADLHHAEEVIEYVEMREMPPAAAPQPPDPEREAFLDAARALYEAARSTSATEPVQPGAVTVRRLSRVEYARTLRDLTGEPVTWMHEFPVDDLSHGFDNLGEALTLSPLHLERYLASAERIAERALPDPDPATPPVVRTPGVRMTAPGRRSGSPAGEAWHFFGNGEIFTEVAVPRDGVYRLRIRAAGDQAGPEPARLAFRVDDRNVATVDVPATRAAPAVYEHDVTLARGRARVGAAFVNDYYKPDDPDPGNRDRNLLVAWVEFVGPLDARPERPLERRFAERDPGGDDVGARARAVLEPFVRRAFRHPVAADELAPLVGLVEDTVAAGEPFHAGVRLAVTAVLASPRFLFRGEEPPAAGEAARDLTSHEIATRLAYFLWSTLPDADLDRAADADALRDAATRRAQVERMLADVRASSLAENFAGQWLELRNLAEAAPDPARFPAFDDDLRTSMRRETEMFVEAIVRERRPLRDLLLADFTFVDGRLARHYDLSGVAADDGAPFRRVALPEERPGGLLTQAGILTITSNPDRTSPVKRGKWVLDNLLADPPPPPPPEVGNLDESPEAVAAASLRERLVRHREAPSCAVCHTRMDALGFALEGYGPTGRPRTHDGEFPVEAVGELPDGRTVDGARGLRALLADEPRFVRCVTKKLLTYAIGRGLTSGDERIVDGIVDALPADASMVDVILGVVESEAFLRQGRAVEDAR